MNNILVPRNIDSRLEKKKQIDLKRIQEYIKNGSEGDLNLGGTFLTKLPDNLVKVGGSLIIINSSIEDLNNLEYIGRGLGADSSKLKSLSKLTQIEGTISISRCPISNIDNLKYVGGNLWIDRTHIKELPEGLKIGENLFVGTLFITKYPTLTSLEKYLRERNIIVEGEIFD